MKAGLAILAALALTYLPVTAQQKGAEHGGVGGRPYSRARTGTRSAGSGRWGTRSGTERSRGESGRRASRGGQARYARLPGSAWASERAARGG